MPHTTPLVSIIIPTLNEEKHIADCLVSVHNQSYPSALIEILLIDNYSSDHTINIAKKYTDNIFTRSGERSAQRNFGIKKSKGKYIFCLDADMRLSPDVIGDGVQLFTSQPKVLGIYIPEVISGNTFLNKVRNFERQFYNCTSIDAVRFVQRTALLKVKCFDPYLMAGEDWDLDKRIRSLGQVSHIKSHIIHMENNLTLSTFLEKKKYYSFYIDRYKNKWGSNDPDIKKQFSISYRLILVFLENGKWKKFISHPYLALSVIFLKCLTGFNMYLSNHEKNNRII